MEFLKGWRGKRVLVPRRLADTSKAKRMLGFEAKIGLEEGLRELVGWWQKEHKDAKVSCV